MITLEQAKSLKPGDEVIVMTWAGHTPQVTRWKVYEPEEERRFDDPDIICYLDGGNGLQSYVFASRLSAYFLPSRGEGVSNE